MYCMYQGLDAKVLFLATVTLKEHGDEIVDHEVAGVGVHVDERAGLAKNVEEPPSDAPAGTVRRVVLPL